MKNAIKTNGSQEKVVLGSPKEDERWGKGQLSSEKADGENGEHKENWELKERKIKGFGYDSIWLDAVECK
jgi:hypothetical protein